MKIKFLFVIQFEYLWKRWLKTSKLSKEDKIKVIQNEQERLLRGVQEL